MISKKEVAEGYDRIADEIIMSDSFYSSCIKILKREIQGKVLDIGCGQGILLEKLLNRFPVNHAVGIDISPKLCSIAASRNNQATISNLDAEDIDTGFSENYFDIIFMTEVLEHLLNPQKVLLKVSKILKNNGELVISVPNRDWFRYKKYNVTRKVFQPVDDHFYRLKEVQKLLEENCFEIKRIRGEETLIHSSGIFRRLDKILLLLFPILNRKMKRLIILAINKKHES